MSLQKYEKLVAITNLELYKPIFRKTKGVK